MPEFSSMDDILNYAIRQEEDAYAFYMEWAGKAKNLRLVRLFEQFAAEEMAHKNFLLKNKENGSELSTLDQKTLLKIEEYVIKHDSVPISEKSANPVEVMFRIVIEKEKAAFNLYTALAKEIQDPQAQVILRGLAQQEALHKLKLEQNFQTISQEH